MFEVVSEKVVYQRYLTLFSREVKFPARMSDGHQVGSRPSFTVERGVGKVVEDLPGGSGSRNCKQWSQVRQRRQGGESRAATWAAAQDRGLELG